MELAITQPFFELDNQDFAWKFVWTIQKKWASMQRKICMEIHARKFYVSWNLL